MGELKLWPFLVAFNILVGVFFYSLHLYMKEKKENKNG